MLRWVCVLALLNCVIIHSFVWRDLSDAELKKWYNPTDLCVLNNLDRMNFPQNVMKKDCRNFSRGSHRIHCRVGMGSNKQPCYPPFGVSRPSFKKGIVGYTDHRKKPLTEAFENLARANVTVVFLGDSTMRQKISAIDCELARENPRHRLIGNLFGILPCHTKYEVLLAGSATPLFMHALHVGPNAVTCLKHNHGSSNTEGSGVFAFARKIIDEINYDGRGVMIIANMGLWYNDPAEFEAVIPRMLKWLVEVASRKFALSGSLSSSIGSAAGDTATRSVRNLVAWHETMRQHWNSADGSGYYDKQIANSEEAEWLTGSNSNASVNIRTMPIERYVVPTCCREITNGTVAADWRNHLVKKHLLQLGEEKRKLVTYFPFAEATRRTADMHVCNVEFKHDCTHYCWWPLLWMPLWHQMTQLASKYVMI